MNSGGGVFDHAEVRVRRLELFPAREEWGTINPRINGGTMHHCDICPLPPGENCQKACSTERQEQSNKDGVTVT